MTPDQWLTLLAIVLGGGGLAQAFRIKRKLKGEEESIIVGAAEKVISVLRAEYEDVNKRLTECETARSQAMVLISSQQTQITNQQVQIDELKRRLRTGGIE